MNDVAAEAVEIDSVLAHHGLFVNQSSSAVAPFLITKEPSGFFYITDRPTNQLDEVFSIHFEARALASRLLARAGDVVLDLGTGSGILLLEAVHKGARGIGIDLNRRALEFAEVNAAINDVIDRVSFCYGDMTAAESIPDWGKPDVIVSNPPFGPVPVGAQKPRHSAGGPLGDEVLAPFLEAMAGWSHKPKAMQLVLCSIAAQRHDEIFPATLASQAHGEGPDLYMWPALARYAQVSGSSLEAREIATPISIADFLVLHYGNKPTSSRSEWMSFFKKAALRGHDEHQAMTMRLFIANFFPAADYFRPAARVWIRYLKDDIGSECFIMPPALQDNLDLRANFSRAAYMHLERARPLLRNPRSLGFDRPENRAFIQAALSYLREINERILLVNICRSHHAEFPIEILTFQQNGLPSIHTKASLAELKQLLEYWDVIGATVCDVMQNQGVRSRLEAGSPEELLEALIPQGASVQSAALVSSWPGGCFTPVQQRLFSCMFLELIEKNATLGATT